MLFNLLACCLGWSTLVRAVKRSRNQTEMSLVQAPWRPDDVRLFNLDKNVHLKRGLLSRRVQHEAGESEGAAGVRLLLEGAGSSSAWRPSRFEIKRITRKSLCINAHFVCRGSE